MPRRRSVPRIQCHQCGKLTKRLKQHLLYCSVNLPMQNRPVTSVSNGELNKSPDPSKIRLKFKESIWVGINGTVYEGKVIEVDNMRLASEIVRIAKEAHGWDILL